MKNVMIIIHKKHKSKKDSIISEAIHEAKQNYKGITLISLIITIIVILILASVTINLIMGENNIFETASWAGYVTEYEAINEKIELYTTQKIVEQYAKLNRIASATNIVITTEQEKKKMYPISDKINIEEVSPSLRQTIKQIEGLSSKELKDETLVNLYKVDLTKVNEKTKKQYVINIISGKLYSIEYQKYKKNLYHTPRTGVKKDFVEIVPKIDRAGKYEMIVDAGQTVEWDSLVIDYDKYIKDSVKVKVYTSDDEEIWTPENVETGIKYSNQEKYNIDTDNKTQYLKVEIEVNEINGKTAEINYILVNFFKYDKIDLEVEIKKEPQIEKVAETYIGQGKITQTVTIPEDEGEYIIDLGKVLGEPTSTVTITNTNGTVETYTITNNTSLRKIPIKQGTTIKIETELEQGETVGTIRVLKKQEVTPQKIETIEKVDSNKNEQEETKIWKTEASKRYMYNNGGEGYWQKCLINEIEVGSTGIIQQGETKRIRVTYQVSEDGITWSRNFTNIQDAEDTRYLQVKVEYQAIEGTEYGNTTNNKIKIILNDGSWKVTYVDEQGEIVSIKRVYFSKANKQANLTMPEFVKAKENGDEFKCWKENGNISNEFYPGTEYTITKDIILVENYITPTISVTAKEESIGQEEFTLEITTNYVDNMVEKYKYYVEGKTPIESKLKTQKITGLTAQTTYQVYVEAYSKAGKVKQSDKITVTTVRLPIKVNSITLNETKGTISKTKTLQLSVTAIGPNDADDKTYYWDSLNKDIATVSSTGLVTGVTAGKAIIRCASTDGGKYVDCIVTVINGITISNRAELEAMSSNLSGEYVLVADIDLSDGVWPRLGTFGGTFDGKGHTISNITTNKENGLFGNVSGGTIKNLKIINPNIGASFCGGALADSIDGYSNISCIAIVGGVKSSQGGGGLAHSVAKNSKISDCYVTISMNSSNGRFSI